MQRVIGIVIAASLIASCAEQATTPARPEPPAPPPRAAPAPLPEARRPEAAPSVPVPPPAPAVAQETTYTVKKGDTLARIAKDHNVALRDLAEWNQIKDARRIKIGQQLRLTPP